MTLELAMISYIQYQKYKQGKKQINWASSKLKNFCAWQDTRKEKETHRIRGNICKLYAGIPCLLCFALLSFPNTASSSTLRQDLLLAKRLWLAEGSDDG